MAAKAYFFDLDGTLIDSEPVWVEAIIAFLADRGAVTTAEWLAPVVEGHSWFDIQKLLHLHFPVLGEATPQEDAVRLRPYYYDLVKENPARIVIRESVEYLRRVASAGAKIAIVSGSPKGDVKAAAELCGVDSLVSLIVGAEDYPNGKPAPDSFLLAAKLFGLEPADCVVVEDSSAGLAAGLAAGMRVIALDRVHGGEAKYAGAAYRVESLSDAPII